MALIGWERTDEIEGEVGVNQEPGASNSDLDLDLELELPI
jgi:hypothetical protein